MANSVIKKNEIPITRFEMMSNETKTVHFTGVSIMSSDRGDLIIGGTSMDSRGPNVINTGALSIVVKSATFVDITNNIPYGTNVMVIGGYPV